MGARHSRGGWLAIVIALALVAAIPAGAAPNHKRFSADVSPSSIVAGLGSTTLTITNNSTSATLGAARITVSPPLEFVIETANSGWVISGNQVTATDPSFSLQPGQSLALGLSVTALQGSDQTYTFAVEARQANNFNGAGNDLNFQGPAPTLTVTGAAKQCANQGNCNLSLAEKKTTATVTAECGSECDIMVLDLSNDCNGQACTVSEAAYWVPPVIDSDKTVTVELFVSGKFKGNEVNSMKFFIAATDSSEFFECGAHPTITCSYTKSKVGNQGVRITATVESVDPRGFAS
ncbi:MAG: hypothetical protein J5I28_01290 [Acidimicrobiales bacterium]|nr:hypothetical protein [Acidimicrobiales bacterium]